MLIQSIDVWISILRILESYPTRSDDCYMTVEETGLFLDTDPALVSDYDRGQLAALGVIPCGERFAVGLTS